MNIIYLEEVDSTNAYARRNLESLPDKTIICALRQSSGHGQFGRKWVDLGPENLFISIIMEQLQPDLTFFAANALCEILAQYGVSAQIKEPNDVLVNGKKIAGILAETVTRGSKTSSVVLGIGVNLNARKQDLALVTDQPITALNLETGTAIEREEFLHILLSHLIS
jgi:BirA family biotin operon repressor/biotin-[acetyl-CoA-carboxylase] ligase